MRRIYIVTDDPAQGALSVGRSFSSRKKALARAKRDVTQGYAHHRAVVVVEEVQVPAATWGYVRRDGSVQRRSRVVRDYGVAFARLARRERVLRLMRRWATP